LQPFAGTARTSADRRLAQTAQRKRKDKRKDTGFLALVHKQFRDYFCEEFLRKVLAKSFDENFF
jgi:hypothetical protein